MSNTTKDRPFWVSLNEPENQVAAVHRCTEYGRECDIDEPLSASKRYNSCYFELPANHPWNTHRCRPHTGDDLRSSYWAPERAAVRESLTDLVKAYRGGDALNDADTITDQSHHAPYYGGYWD